MARKLKQIDQIGELLGETLSVGIGAGGAVPTEAELRCRAVKETERYGQSLRPVVKDGIEGCLVREREGGI